MFPGQGNDTRGTSSREPQAEKPKQPSVRTRASNEKQFTNPGITTSEKKSGCRKSKAATAKQEPFGGETSTEARITPHGLRLILSLWVVNLVLATPLPSPPCPNCPTCHKLYMLRLLHRRRLTEPGE